jgi:hypothetical protein
MENGEWRFVRLDVGENGTIQVRSALNKQKLRALQKLGRYNNNQYVPSSFLLPFNPNTIDWFNIAGERED